MRRQCAVKYWWQRINYELREVVGLYTFTHPGVDEAAPAVACG